MQRQLQSVQYPGGVVQRASAADHSAPDPNLNAAITEPRSPFGICAGFCGKWERRKPDSLIKETSQRSKNKRGNGVVAGVHRTLRGVLDGYQNCGYRQICNVAVASKARDMQSCAHQWSKLMCHLICKHSAAPDMGLLLMTPHYNPAACIMMLQLTPVFWNSRLLLFVLLVIEEGISQAAMAPRGHHNCLTAGR